MFESLFDGVREKLVCPYHLKTYSMAYATSVERHRSPQPRGNFDQGCREVRAI